MLPQPASIRNSAEPRGETHSTSTRSTRAAGGPSRRSASSVSSARFGPSASTRTDRFGMFRTEPDRWSSRARDRTKSRNPTPWTRPSTRATKRASSCGFMEGSTGGDGRRVARLDAAEVGRGERIRTSDPLVPNQVLYQAEPRPDPLPHRTTRSRPEFQSLSTRRRSGQPTSPSRGAPIIPERIPAAVQRTSISRRSGAGDPAGSRRNATIWSFALIVLCPSSIAPTIMYWCVESASRKT